MALSPRPEVIVDSTSRPFTATVNFVGLGHATGNQFQAGSDSHAVTLSTSQLEADPMISRNAFIPKHQRRSIDVVHYDIQLAIIE